MTARLSTRYAAGLLAVCLVILAAMVGALPASAEPTTDPAALVGEGGSFLTPVTDVLLKADTAGLAPLNPSYTDANLDNAVTDFIGNGPGSSTLTSSSRSVPLTSGEAATAKANGRTFAYVPFAATPVAVATLAPCNPSELMHLHLDCGPVPGHTADRAAGRPLVHLQRHHRPFERSHRLVRSTPDPGRTASRSPTAAVCTRPRRSSHRLRTRR